MKRGLILGRFQPFHQGHLYLIRYALKQVDSVVIAVGSVNKSDSDNPFTFEERFVMIDNALKKARIRSQVEGIIPLEDNPDNAIWLANLEKKAGHFDIAFGNNEWPNGILENGGHTVIRVPFYKRDIYEGKKLRAQMSAA